MAKFELNDAALENILGGTAYNPVNKTIGIDKDHMIYHYDNFDAVFAWIDANVRNFPPETREQDVINGLLKANLIW